MSTTWFYYNEQSEKIAVTVGQLKELASSGKIAPETLVETPDGKTGRAGKVKGLSFATSESSASGSAPSEPAQPVESEVYGLVAPPPKPSPFIATMPETVNKPVAAPTTNPFTASMPVVSKPVVDSSTPVPPAAAKSASPFTISVPTPSQVVPQSVAVPVAENKGHKNPRNPIPLFIGAGVLFLALVLVGGFWAIGTYQRWDRDEETRFKKEQREADHRGDIQIQDMKRESQIRIARTQAEAEIEKLRIKHQQQMAGARFNMIEADRESQEMLLDLELKQFRSRIEREFLATYGVHLDPEKAARDKAANEQAAQERAAREQAAKNVLTAAERAQFTAAEQAEIEKFCAQYGSDVKANGDTFFHSAIKSKNKVVAKFLISRGVNVNAGDSKDRYKTMLHKEMYNTSRPDEQLIRLFIELGANVNAVDTYKGTPLHAAAFCGNVVAVEILLENGADPNATDSEGATSLHAAIRGLNCSVRLVRLLLENGADPLAKKADIISGRQETPEQMAGGKVDIIMVIREFANKNNSKDKP
jgi:hypothetical protein